MQLTLVDKSYQHIRKKLATGELSPGSRLVTRTLASELGVSLGPIREAINRLATEGLVDHIPGAGASVREPNRQDLNELYTLRDAIESCAAAEAAKYITDDQLDQLESILDDFDRLAEEILSSLEKIASLEKFHQWLANDENFHEVMIEASRNRLLVKVAREHRAINRIFAAQRNAPELLTPDVIEHTCADHRQLLEALRSRNGEQARALVSKQIEIGRKTVLAFLSQRQVSQR